MGGQINQSLSVVGRWRRVVTADEANPDEEVTMVFTPDGKLVYVVHDREGRHIIHLVYRVAGDTLITDQPSEPRPEHTKFSFEADGTLILDYGGIKSWFERAE